MTEGAARKFESLPELLDRISAESYEAGNPVIMEHHDWYRISMALRCASAWLDGHDLYVNTTDARDYAKYDDGDKPHNRLQRAREAFRRALEGEAE